MRSERIEHGVVRRDGTQDGAVSVPDLDHALHLERDQCLPQGRAAHVERGGELALGRETVTRGELQLVHEPEESLDELLVQARPFHGAQRRQAQAARLCGVFDHVRSMPPIRRAPVLNGPALDHSSTLDREIGVPR